LSATLNGLITPMNISTAWKPAREDLKQFFVMG
jgi:hypothetical protein